MERRVGNSCPSCGGNAELVSDAVEGYQEGLRFSIYTCMLCTASFAVPMQVYYDLYELIYRNIRQVPGYSRYERYAHDVLSVDRPLAYLMSREETYWAVAGHLLQKKRLGKELQILEVGCGLGYFTYALVREGFNACGIDLSREAIAWANDHYGRHYSAETLHTLGTRGKRYDVIVMNQLIEHVVDVNMLVATALTLLAPGGELMITTPNKSDFPNSVWETELPPVHLWWFTEESLRRLAERHGCSATLTDFAPYYRSIPTPKPPVRERRPVFDARGRLASVQEAVPLGLLRRTLDQMGALNTLRKIKMSIAGQERRFGSRGPVLAAVLHRA